MKVHNRFLGVRLSVCLDVVREAQKPLKVRACEASLCRGGRLIGVLLLFFLSLLSAQEFRATLQGTILDPNGAVIPGANVSLVNTATAVERKTITNGEGHYLFQFLPPGTYSINAQAGGFKTEARDGVVLALGDNARMDMGLSLGQASDTVTVEATAVTLATESSSLGSTVPREIVDTLALKGHGTFPMATLAAGVLDTGNNFRDDVRPIDQTNNLRFTANGAPVGAGDVSIDGVSNLIDVGRGQNVNGYVPPQDSIAEFKMQTGTLPAEYGRSGGSIMNVVLRSGTNLLHGSAYEFLRNAALDANPFFSNLVGQKLPVYQVNLFGGSLGGPVYIPKVYNGKNRSFFFFNYEGTRQSQVSSGRSNLPTPLMRTGNFSQLTTSIYDPFSTSTVGSVVTRSVFAGNVIPVSRQDPVGKNLMQYWPQPNLPGTTNAWTSNFAQTTTFKGLYDTYTVKFDQSISSKQQMFVRFNWMPSALVEMPYNFNGIGNTGQTESLRPSVGAALSDTYIVSPTIAVDFRLGFSRGANNVDLYSTEQGFDPATLGFSQSYLKLIDGPGFPGFTFADGITGLGNNTAKSQYYGDTYTNAEAVTINRGKHLFKTGADIRVTRGNQLGTGGNGTFAFRSNETGGPNAATPAGGFGLASMLLGVGSSGSVGSGSAISWQTVYYGFFFQDDYRVTTKLTLNLGVRYEYETPKTERYNRTVRGFDYNATNPVQVPGLKLTGGLLFAGVGGLPRGLLNPDRNNIQPRIGFAYSLNNKMVVRGGFAMSYIPTVNGLVNSGYSISTPWVTSTDSGITVANLLSNPFPGGKLSPIGSSQGLGTLVGQGISFVDPSGVAPQFQNWQLSIQHSLPGRALLEVAYVGSHGVHLLGPSINLDQVPAELFSQGTTLTQSVANPFLGILTTGTLSGTMVQRSQLVRPYPEFTSVTKNSPTNANSTYHALQAKYQKGMSHGMTSLVTYTWSKNLTNSFTPQNIYDTSQERGPSSIDAAHRLSIAFTWDIPVGRKRQFLAHINRFADMAIGGWQLSTSSSFQSGAPLGIGVSGGTYLSNSIRANVVGDPTIGASGAISQRINHYFNTAAFAVPANFTLGNSAPRFDTLRNPGQNGINLVLAKSFAITEKLRLEFRAMEYNVVNHPVFGGPNTTVGSTAFGTISSQANNARQSEVVGRFVW